MASLRVTAAFTSRFLLVVCCYIFAAVAKESLLDAGLKRGRRILMRTVPGGLPAKLKVPPPAVSRSPPPKLSKPTTPKSSRPPPAKAIPPPKSTSSPPPRALSPPPKVAPPTNSPLPSTQPSKKTNATSVDGKFLGGCSDPQLVLDLHNSYRRDHHAAPLTWDNDLAVSSLAYARFLAEKGCPLDHDPDPRFGENLFFSRSVPKPSTDCASAVQGWYMEVNFYVFKTDTPFRENRNKNRFHFSQLVWKASTKVGCGVYVHDETVEVMPGRFFAGGCKMVVCRYTPPGNIGNENAFKENVLPK